MENLDINKNFYSNICEPLFKEDKLLLKAIQLFYDSKKYKEIKNSFKINSKILKLYYLDYVIAKLNYHLKIQKESIFLYIILII